ncbi:YihY/virulence factor BrkB family protein [Corynebacterium sp. HMSC074A01]|uniref:YihY/virulence factor BrkB family protein n=1 Tax=Corynebacterium sp. HMSC074A01 TaxID=1715030 RepID=UPI0008A57CC1|nr:YihY/virulence factor BrkB family protein [Corynebacterium sp. HMSC074A01]OHF37422.1 hypothetical protein HMPREF2550_03375 [Corynebacterium sp. HMSC074A01]
MEDAEKGPEIVSRRIDFVLPYGIGELDVPPPPDTKPNPLDKSNRLTKAGWVLVAKRLVADFSNDAMVDRGATLTYYTVLSLAPMVVSTYAIATLLLSRDPGAVDQLLAQLVQNYVPEALRGEAMNLLEVIVGTPSQSTVALTVSLVLSLLAASAYVRSFSRNANLVYGRTEGRPMVVTWVTMWLITLMLVVGAVGILLGTLLTESIVETVLGPIARPLGLEGVLDYLTGKFLPVWGYLRGPTIVLMAMILLSLMYYFSPNVRPGRFRLLTLGSAAALLVGFLLWWGFGVYLSTIGVRSAYGAFGTVLAVLALVWVMNIVLLEGVKIDAEVLRAKELQVGYDSERTIQARPRSSEGTKWRLKVQRWIARSEREVKNSRVDLLG